MISGTNKLASLGIAILFVFAGVSQAIGSISSCSMPCCQGKADPCHTPKERTPKANACCGETASFALGSGCEPEHQEANDFSTVSYSPFPSPQGLEMSIVEAHVLPSQGQIPTMTAPAPHGKAPLYLQNLNLLI